MLQVAYAEFELEAIMLTESCNEVPHRGSSSRAKLPPPKGLHLYLGTTKQQHMVRCNKAGQGMRSWHLMVHATASPTMGEPATIHSTLDNARA